MVRQAVTRALAGVAGGFSTIFVRLLLLYLAITLMSFALIGLTSSWIFQYKLRSDVGSSVKDMQERMIGHMQNVYERGWSREELLASLGPGHYRDMLHVVYDADGAVLYTVGGVPEGGWRPADGVALEAMRSPSMPVQPLPAEGEAPVEGRSEEGTGERSGERPEAWPGETAGQAQPTLRPSTPLQRPQGAADSADGPTARERAPLSEEDIALVGADVIAAAISGVPESVELDREQGGRLFVFAAPIQLGGDAEERAIVTLFGGFQRNVTLFVRPSLLGALFALPIAAIAFYYFSRRLTRPLKAMSETALKLAKGEFHERVPVTTGDEVGRLGQTLNYMAGELASLDDMRREFLANVSHDMRAPLTSINGFTAALLDGTIPDERRLHYLQMIQESGTRMMKLVEDVLEMARIDSGQFAIQPEPFNLSEHIRQTAAAFEPIMQQHGLSVRFDEGETDYMVTADPYRIVQALTNLIENAVSHSPAGGEITLSCRADGDRVVAAVSDQGCGIAADDLPHIWERFYKGDKARSKRAGTGIGLSIVKHILDRHGSSIEVESAGAGGRGTTFRFDLPRFFRQL